jgi:dipeptidyl aminopeptidase/acylaminoacyl peptidase
MLDRRSLFLTTAAAGAVAALPAEAAPQAALPPAAETAAPLAPKPHPRAAAVHHGGPDYEHALGLRDAWTYLTENLAEPATWVEGASRFYYRKTVKGGFQFVMVDAKTLEKAPAFDHDRLAAALSKASEEPCTGLRLPFPTFHFVDGEPDVIEFGGGEDGGAWRCSLKTYAVTRRMRGRPRGFGVVRDLAAPADNKPKLSPDKRWEAFVEGFNVAVRPVGGGAIPASGRLLSSDGSEGDFYDPETIVWSPDSKKLIAYRVQPGFRREVLRVESSPADQVQPKLQTQLYPKPGDRVDLEQPVVFHVDPAMKLDVPNALFPNPYRLTKAVWRKDSATATFEYDQRGHQLYRVIEVDAETGQARAPVTEQQKTFVNIERMFRHDVDDLGREIVWMSERDGWNHLYLIDGQTGEVKSQITKGEWIVRKVLKVDDEKRQVWFAASGMYPGKDPYFQHAYRVDFDGSNLTTLTQADAWHDVALSGDLEYYVDTFSRIDLPNVSQLRRTSDGSVVAELEKADVSKLVEAGFKPPEVFVAKGRDGSTDIWGIVVKPRDFDPSKSYPVIENIYAGPHDSFVPKTFWPFGAFGGGDKVVGMQANADMGFILVMMDGTGTMNRSKAFHDVCWKNIGDAGFPDRIAWHKAYAAKHPWYDIGRVGIYGGSAGGQNALGGLLFHPEFYKAAVAYAGCHDNRMDKISWNEQWMGWPVDESYARSSNVDNAWRLKGQLSLIVGEQDSNVDPSSTLQVVNALIKADKTFDLLVVPGVNHGAGRTIGPVRYAMRKQFDFFRRTLRGEGAPDWNAAAAKG